MIRIEVEEHDLWVIRYALKIMAGKAPMPNCSEPGEKRLADEADEVLVKLHRQT